MTNIELFLAQEGGSVNTVSEDDMANTSGNSGMRPSVSGGKGRKRK